MYLETARTSLIIKSSASARIGESGLSPSFLIPFLPSSSGDGDDCEGHTYSLSIMSSSVPGGHGV